MNTSVLTRPFLGFPLPRSCVVMSLVKLTRVGPVAVLELRNGKVNALSNSLLAELSATLSYLASENDVGAIVIRGSNKAFSGVSCVLECYLRAHLIHCSWRRYWRVEGP